MDCQQSYEDRILNSQDSAVDQDFKYFTGRRPRKWRCVNLSSRYTPTAL